MPSLGVLGLIDQALLNKLGNAKTSGRLAMSSVGEECDRKTWYELHKPIPITDPRTQRIFDVGNMYEKYIIQLLRDAGIQVFDRNANGEQFKVVACDGAVAGKVDAVVKGLPESSVPHVLECKSMNSKNFKELIKLGVKGYSDRHYGQCQMYMGELKLTRCLYIAINKDDCELYSERIKFDSFSYEVLKNKAIEITNAKSEPDRAYKEGYYKCRWCNYKKECWDELV